MINTILICSSVLVTGFFLLILVNRRVAKEKEALLVALHSYFESPGEDKPSEFAALVDTTAEIQAQKITQSLKATFMGMQSVDNRNEKGLEADIAQAIVGQQNPMLAALIGSFPSLKKRLTKNPELLPLAEKLLNSSHDRSHTGDHGSGEYEANRSKYT